jgi:UDP-GlcNAc:undecaprenyl-phosphate GlcNAc-1-phosphate transferase
MSFPTKFYALALLSSALTTALALPPWRAWCLRTGLVDDPGHRKIHEKPVALAGGLAVLTGFLVPLVAAFVILKFGFVSLPGTTPSRRLTQVIAIVAGAVAMVVLGWFDDKHELRPAVKFAGQFFIAGLVAAAGVRITLFVPSLVFSYAITILWILTVINAFNFMDNMNGLCAGLGAVAALEFAVLSALQEQYLVALLAFLTCGALLGFLPYNFPNARAFLGDAGSHLVGYLLAVTAILPHFYSPQNPHAWAVLSPLLVLAVPLADLVWVVILRWRMGKPFYVGDTNHLSHRLVRSGMSRTKAVMVIWLLAAAVGGLVFL